MKEHRKHSSLVIGMCRRAPLIGMALLCLTVLASSGAAPAPLLQTNAAPGQIAAALGRKTLQGHVPAVTAGLRSKGRLPATRRLALEIGLPLRNQDALNTLLQEMYNPASPQYRHYLTPGQFTEQFGPTEQDYDTVAAFAMENGLTVTATTPNRILLVVSGSVADIEKTFNVKMQVYQHPKENRTFYAPDVEPAVDAAIPVLHISGLDNYQLPHPKNLRRSSADQAVTSKSGSGSGQSGNYIGNDFRAAYAPGVSLDGSGQAVGVIEFGGYYASDITSYETKAGLPSVPVTTVLAPGVSGNPQGTDTTEQSLDIELAIDMAPGLSQVIVYEGSTALSSDVPPLNNIVLNLMATNVLAAQLSCSWDMHTDTNTDNIFKEFQAQGQSFFDASGDNGAYSGIIPSPDDNPYITIVGGTTLTTTGPGGSWVSEKTWSWGAPEFYASAGGISLNYSIPTYAPWQQGISMSLNQGSTTMRNIPDVAMTADNVYVIANNGQKTTGNGGTSCAAPLWAGFMALVNQQAAANGLPPVGFINPAVYAIGQGTSYDSCFHDITTGNNSNRTSNSKFSAVTGYDLCTGWGTPNGQALIDAFAPRLDAGSVSPSTGVTNDTFTYRVNYSDGTGSAPLSNNVCIDGSLYVMQLESGSAANGTYKFVTNGFSLGSHNYQFKFRTAQGQNFSFPTGSSTLSGPTVMLRVAEPTFSPSDGTNGTYPVLVTLSCATAGADIRYTTNGTSPTASSQLYSNVPLTVAGSVLLTCVGFENGMLSSPTNSLYYNFPALKVSPSSNNFGYVVVGTQTDFTFTVQNSGGGTLVGSAGGLSDPFQILSGSNYTLNASQSQTVVVQYAPTAEVTNTENISFTGGDGAVCAVTGVGYIPPVIFVTPANLDFGMELVGCTNGAVLNFTVQNIGGSMLSGTSTVSAPFTVVTGSKYNLGAGQTSNVSMRYAPTANGAQTRNVVFTGGGGTTCSVSGVTIGVLNIKSVVADVTPLPGIYSNVYGTTLTNIASLTSENGATQYACRGWTMTGNAPTTGTTNICVMTQTNNATLTWLWKTNYFLLMAHASGSGLVDVAGIWSSAASNWYASGTSVTVRAAPTGAAHFFGWAGDTNGATISGTNITVKMTQARSITANFGLYLSVQAMGLNNSTQKIAIAVTPNDYSNKASGTTPFTRSYGEQTSVTCSAPATLSGGWKFAYWTGADTTNSTNATVTMMSNTTVRAWYDPAPTVVITNPTTKSTYTTTNQTLNIMGRASNVCTITEVDFSDSRSGLGMPCNGTTNWSYTGGIMLYNGANVITVIAYDQYGNVATGKLTVTYSSKYSKLQNLVLLGGAVVRSISMADGAVPWTTNSMAPGTTNTIQWQIESYEPVLSGLKIRLPAGGSVTNVTLNGFLTGVTNGASLLGDWQSMVYSFETNWIAPNVGTGGMCRIRFLAAREDGYAYLNANIPDGTDQRPYGPDGKEIARDISAVGPAVPIQNDTLTKASSTFDTLSQAKYRAGGIAQVIQITNNLTPNNVVTCRWSILSYPSIQARMRVELPGGSNFVGTGTLKATSNTSWRLPASGTLVEYNSSVSNDYMAKVSSSYKLEQYYYQYALKVPTNIGPCGIVFEVAPSSVTNWVYAILPDGADGTNATDGVTIERQIGP